MAATDQTDDAAFSFAFDACPECRHLELEGPDPVEYVVAPSDGGGWDQWAAAFLRLLRRIGDGPTQVFVVTQDSVTDRYLQALVGHGRAHVEASSNVYLEGESRLTEDDEALLVHLGWQRPHSDVDVPGTMPANWTLPLVEGDWDHVTQMVLATLVAVHRFDPSHPVRLSSFQATHPCRTCSWGDDEDEPDAE